MKISSSIASLILSTSFSFAATQDNSLTHAKAEASKPIEYCPINEAWFAENGLQVQASSDSLSFGICREWLQELRTKYPQTLDSEAMHKLEKKLEFKRYSAEGAVYPAVQLLQQAFPVHVEDYIDAFGDYCPKQIPTGILSNERATKFLGQLLNHWLSEKMNTILANERIWLHLDEYKLDHKFRKPLGRQSCLADHLAESVYINLPGSKRISLSHAIHAIALTTRYQELLIMGTKSKDPEVVKETHKVLLENKDQVERIHYHLRIKIDAIRAAEKNYKTILQEKFSSAASSNFREKIEQIVSEVEELKIETMDNLRNSLASGYSLSEIMDDLTELTSKI